jgi:outer membrane biosynthesis protein TonB
MTSNRTKLLRGVLVFLVGCAVLGFVMGLRGAMPAGDIDYEDAATTQASNVVVEAAPMEDALPPQSAAEEEPAAREEPEEEAAPEPQAEPEPAPKPEPKPKPAPQPAPKEEPRPDPVGDLIPVPPALNNLY